MCTEYELCSVPGGIGLPHAPSLASLLAASSGGGVRSLCAEARSAHWRRELSLPGRVRLLDTTECSLFLAHSKRFCSGTLLRFDSCLVFVSRVRFALTRPLTFTYLPEHSHSCFLWRLCSSEIRRAELI